MKCRTLAVLLQLGLKKNWYLQWKEITNMLIIQSWGYSCGVMNVRLVIFTVLKINGWEIYWIDWLCSVTLIAFKFSSILHYVKIQCCRLVAYMIGSFFIDGESRNIYVAYHITKCINLQPLGISSIHIHIHQVYLSCGVTFKTSNVRYRCWPFKEPFSYSFHLNSFPLHIIPSI